MPAGAAQRIERIYLVVERDDLAAYRSLEGAVVHEREVARDLNAATLRGRADLVVTAASEMLRVPPSPGGGRPTPARLRAVGDLADAGLLPAAVRDDLVRAGRVADGEWRAIAPLWELFESREQSFWIWKVALLNSARQPIPLPVPHDPWADLDGSYPSSTVDAAVSTLAASGWTLERIDRRYWDQQEDDCIDELARAGEDPESTTHVLSRTAANDGAGSSRSDRRQRGRSVPAR